MGKFLMPATLSRTVANGLSQLSQSRTTLRQCDSCPYPFRDRAPTVALSREGCWREKQTVADRDLRGSLVAPRDRGVVQSQTDWGASTARGLIRVVFSSPQIFKRCNSDHTETRKTFY